MARTANRNRTVRRVLASRVDAQAVAAEAEALASAAVEEMAVAAVPSVALAARMAFEGRMVPEEEQLA